MADPQMNTFIDTLASASQKLAVVHEELKKTAKNKLLNEVVVTQVQEARDQVNAALQETNKVIEAAAGIEGLLIKPISNLIKQVSKRANLGTFFTVIFGILGIISAVNPISTANLLLFGEGRNKVIWAKNKSPTALTGASPNGQAFLTDGDKDFLFGSTSQLEELKKILADTILDSTLKSADNDKKKIKDIGYAIKNVRGYTDDQIHLLKGAFGLVFDRTGFSVKELETIQDPSLKTDKLFLLAILKANTED